VGPRIGRFKADAGGVIEANKSMENSPSVLFDALVLPDGAAAVETLAADGHTAEFIKDTFRHLKTILVLGASTQLMDAAGLTAFVDGDAGIVVADVADADIAIDSFVSGLAQFKHFARETDPPAI
jgi:catalase